MPQSFRVVRVPSLLGVAMMVWAAVPPGAALAEDVRAGEAEGGEGPAAAAPARAAQGEMPTLAGPIGLLGTSTADVGPVHQLRLGLHSEYFKASNFLIEGDSNQRLRGGLVVGYTPHRRLELFGALFNSSNRNTRTRDAQDVDPELIKSFGDLVVGAKGVFPLTPAATLGVELGLKFLAGVSDLALSPSSTSFWVGPVFSYDLRKASRPVPVRLHAAANFYLDNSASVQDLARVSRASKEVAMFGYGIAPRRLRLAVAADAPLPPGTLGPVALDPFVEYHVEYVTGTADQTFADYASPVCGQPGAKACVDNRDAHWFTLGLRAAVYRQLTVDLGVDVRVRSPGFRYGVPVPPFNLIVGLSLPIDVDLLTGAKASTRVVERPAPPTEGYVTGQVRSVAGGSPVAGATIAVVGRTHARAATDADGGFTTLNLPLGPVELEVSASNFEPLKVVTTVVAGRPEHVVVSMRPKAPTAAVHGRVSNRQGRGVDATVKFNGRGTTDGNFEARSDATGAYALTLPVGTYRARTEAAPFPSKDAEVQLGAGEDKTLDFVLRPAPASPDVFLAGEAIRTKRPLRFVGVTANLLPASEKVLDAVAELLEVHVEIKRVQIIAHWDNSLPKGALEELTRAQAETVKRALVARGIAEGRLTIVGQGAARPLVPNLTPASRQRNRRIEFHLE